MKRNRVVFLLSILLGVVVWTVGKQSAVAVLILAAIVCAALEIFIARYVSRRISWDMQCVSSAAKESKVVLRFRVRNVGIFSTSRAVILLQCKNLLTGESELRRIGFAVSGKTETEVSAEFSFYRCGKISFVADEVMIYDSLGLFGFAKKALTETAVLVLPQLYATRLEISPGQAVDLDSDEYSMYRSGFDASQIYALREYKAGDPIKNIHWKLSQKTEEPIVRELSLPIQNSLLILIENVSLDMQDTFDTAKRAEIAEAIGEIAVSLSMALCEQKYEHQIAWYDHERQYAECCEISSEDELSALMPQILSAELQSERLSTAEQLASQKGILEYAHIIVITPHGAVERDVMPIAAETEMVWIDAGDCRNLREKGIYAEV